MKNPSSRSVASKRVGSRAARRSSRSFQNVFGGLRDRVEGPPYLSIQPLDLRVQLRGGTAVFTFHLGDERPFARRTLVFARDGDRWRVMHLHASGAPPIGG